MTDGLKEALKDAQKQPQTNFDRITESEETLAEWIEETFDLCGAGCSKCVLREKCLSDDNNKMSDELWVEWLKEIHHDGSGSQEKER